MNASNQTTRRRWFQFRLRTVLIAVAICAAIFAWPRYEYQRRQREIATIVELRTGRVQVSRQREVSISTDSTWGFWRQVVEMSETKREPRWWHPWTDPIWGPTVRSIAIDLQDGTDLSLLQIFHVLQVLNIQGIAKPADLAIVGQLTNLEDLSILLDEGDEPLDLRPLVRLRKLQHLNLLGVREADLSPLTKLEHLEFLRLSGLYQHETIDLAWLTPLAESKSLRTLSVDNVVADDLSQLTIFINLKKLEFLGSRIRDYSALAELSNLKELRLLWRTVDWDRSSLKELKQLKKLVIVHASEDDLQALQTALSNCEVIKSERDP